MLKQDGWFTTALHIRNWVILRVFSKGQKSSWPDYSSHFDIAIGFFQEFLLKKNNLLRVSYLAFDQCGWIALIQSEILITTGMVWPVSSDKWKVPVRLNTLLLVNSFYIMLGKYTIIKYWVLFSYFTAKTISRPTMLLFYDVCLHLGGYLSQ